MAGGSGRSEPAYAAGLRLWEAGDRAGALDALLRVAATEPEYPAACIRAVALACELDAPGIGLDLFLAPFLARGPVDEAELAAFYDIGAHYAGHGFADQAREAFERLAAARPGYRDTQARLVALDVAEAARRRSGAQRVLDDERSFRDRTAPRHEPPVWPAPPEPPLPGAGLAGVDTEGLVAGRYRLSREIGRGGMSVVYQATDLELGEQIALKTFTEQVHGDEAQARLLREMQLSRRLVHHNVLRLYDLGFHHGRRYLTMELLLGLDLRRRLAGPLDPRTAVDYLVQACNGLQAAHDLGTVHRDVKPENLFVTVDGVLKLMDFGIAKVLSAPNLTLAGTIWGTPRYIAPEQIDSSAAVGPAADLYSLGVVAYEMLTGQVPFDHPELTGLLAMHMNQAPVPLRQRVPEVAEELEALTLTLLAKDPAKRFASCRELAARLEACRPVLGS